MFSNAFVWHFLFKISIFILFSYHVIGLISRYIIPFLFSSIKQDHDDQMRLVEKDKLLVSTKRRVEGQIHHQKTMFALLERNVQVWHKKKQLDIENKEAEYSLRQKTLEHKRSIQEKNFCLQKDLRVVTLDAIQHARIRFEQQYGGKEGGTLLSSMIEKCMETKKP